MEWLHDSDLPNHIDVLRDIMSSWRERRTTNDERRPTTTAPKATTTTTTTTATTTTTWPIGLYLPGPFAELAVRQRVLSSSLRRPPNETLKALGVEDGLRDPKQLLKHTLEDHDLGKAIREPALLDAVLVRA